MSEGKIFYERIGTIRVLLDGDCKAVFDLGEMLAKLPKPEEPDPDHHWGWLMSELRRDWFATWYANVLREREKAGLTVVVADGEGGEGAS